MLPTYTLVCIPLDAADPTGKPDEFDVRVVCQLQFPEGTFQPSKIRDVLAQHPILSLAAGATLRAWIWDLQSWEANQRAIDTAAATPATLKFIGPKDLQTLKTALLNYLGVNQSVVVAGPFVHDRRFDDLTADHFVDVSKAADDVKAVTEVMFASATDAFQGDAALTRNQTSFRAGADDEQEILLTPTSFRAARWINSAAQATLLETLSGEEGFSAQSIDRLSSFAKDLGTKDLSETVNEIRANVTRVRRRLQDPKRKCTNEPQDHKLRSVSNSQTAETSLDDPNVALHAAAKHPLMAQECGFVTAWSAISGTPLKSGVDYVLQLDFASLTYDSSVVTTEATLPTAFRRDTHTHPLAFVDIGKTSGNGALAQLNNATSGRYRASSINSEAAVVKQVVVQQENTIARAADGSIAQFGAFKVEATSVDDRPPELLRQVRHGLPEPETSGVTISAPIDDLVKPAGLKPFDTPDLRRTKMPCFFLEDLWIGYRFDLRETSPDGARPFRSIHRQNQTLAFTQSGETVAGPTEDYAEREQPDDESLGHTSAELMTYTGLSTGQQQDYLIALGTERTEFVDPAQPFRVNIDSYAPTTPLTFGHVYDYRLRNVFLGGVSCESDDGGLLRKVFNRRYTQTFPFYRARTIRPGEVVSQDADADGKTIYLTAQKPRTFVTLLPAPIDLDTARFHGILFRSESEIVQHLRRRFLSDLGKAFPDLPPDDLDYFFDPDVHGVVINPRVLNGMELEDPEELMYVDGAYCRLTRHRELETVKAEFGPKGNWEVFRPIVISFRASKLEGARVRERGTWLGCRHIEVVVPPAAEMHLSIAPLIDAKLLAKTASATSSSAQLHRHKTVGGVNQSIVPAVAEHLIKVIHAVERPRRRPVLVCEDTRVRPAAASVTAEPCVARRELDSEYADVVGRIELDAASTKEVRLEAVWIDVSDRPRQERYTLESGTASSVPRSVIFREHEPIEPTAAAFGALFVDGGVSEFRVQEDSSFGFGDQFTLQCAEDKVFLGRKETARPSPAGDAVQSTNRINVKDQRRKLMRVEAVAVSRFTDKFPNAPGGAEVRSDKVQIDVPSTVRMTAPLVDHVVPLRRILTQGNDKTGKTVTTFGLRIYARRPWFESGFGERLAIACSTGEDPAPVKVAEVPKHITQWGEDPLERPGLRSSRRLPRASDFLSIHEPGAVRFDEDLYPGVAGGAREPVIYRDSIQVSPAESDGVKRSVSVASYALRYDERQGLWYADVYVQGDFFGWCGLAIYRHQPHAHPERELSSSAEWVYGAVLYGEPVAWIEREGHLFITIGPVYDRSVSFEFDSLEYVQGVSEEVANADRQTQPLHSYEVDGAMYFEGVLTKKAFHWSLLRKRFANEVGSAPLRGNS